MDKRDRELEEALIKVIVKRILKNPNKPIQKIIDKTMKEWNELTKRREK